ncbi:MAG: adenylate/guanylate cyclase domain-containing protein [Actinomycetota bacterium]
MAARDAEQLAEQAGVPVAFVHRLVELEILPPAGDGTFSDADVYRVRFVWASDRGGLAIETIAVAVREGRFSLAFMDNPNYRFASLSPSTYAEVAGRVGLPVDFVLAFEEALGKVRPGPDDAAPEDLTAMLELPRRSLAAGVDTETHLRLIRVYADALRRIAETEGDVFHRRIEVPQLEAGLSHGEMLQVVNPIGADLTPGMEALVMAIYRRQQERVWTDDGVQHMESAIEEMGLYVRPERPTAFAFLDLTGYTRLTEERGDEAAAGLAANLTELVHDEVGRGGGKAVKWLGDGVMVSFRDAAAAVLATIGVGRRTGDVGLPPAHAGVAVGPVIFQDGEYYGRTVNLAARLSGFAGPGQTLVDQETVRHVRDRDDLRFRSLGDALLKGMVTPIEVYEAECLTS